MATSWKSQQGNGEYRLQFETDNEEKYKLVEKAAQMAMDGKTKADFVEVPCRCKKCRYGKLMGDHKTYVCIRQAAYKKADDYCSSGKRK